MSTGAITVGTRVRVPTQWVYEDCSRVKGDDRDAVFTGMVDLWGSPAYAFKHTSGLESQCREMSIANVEVLPAELPKERPGRFPPQAGDVWRHKTHGDDEWTFNGASDHIGLQLVGNPPIHATNNEDEFRKNFTFVRHALPAELPKERPAEELSGEGLKMERDLARAEVTIKGGAIENANLRADLAATQERLATSEGLLREVDDDPDAMLLPVRLRDRIEAHLAASTKPDMGGAR